MKAVGRSAPHLPDTRAGRTSMRTCHSITGIISIGTTHHTIQSSATVRRSISQVELVHRYTDTIVHAVSPEYAIADHSTVNIRYYNVTMQPCTKRIETILSWCGSL